MELIYLQKNYDELYGNLSLQKKLKKKSILLSFLDIKSNIRHELLQASAISCEHIPKYIFNEMKECNYLREADEINKYILTAKSISEFERANLIDNNMLIEYIDDKYFNISQASDGLTPKEKVIIFAMLCSRTFSKSNTIDLKIHCSALDAWEKIVIECNKILSDLDVIKKISDKDLFGRTGNEHKVSNLFRHTDILPKKTKGIYKAAGNQKYYLDISEKNNIDSVKLKYIIKTIFSKCIINHDDIKNIVDFNFDVAYKYSFSIFNSEDIVFTSPKYDDVIKQSYIQAIFID